MISDLFFIFLGGGFGSLMRYLVIILGEKAMNHFYDSSHPIGTFVVNLVGSFAIGILYGLFRNNLNVSNSLYLFLTIGFLGGFTTFSSFSLDAYKLIQSGELIFGLIYIVLSVLLSLIFTFLGIFISNYF